MMILRMEAVPFSDRLLLQHIRSKASHLEGVQLRYHDIARETGISRATVQRSLCRLETAGLIVRLPGFGRSYVYRVINDECA